jgi:ribosomal protein S7
VIADTRKRAIPTFSVAPTIDGFEVIDNATGRPLDTRPTRASAQGFAYILNGAAARGPKALARALKAA